MTAIDLNKIATAAAKSYLENGSAQSRNGQPESRSHRFGGVSAIALGVGLAFAARAAVNRARKVDLGGIAESVESKLSR
jgi:hypothetical protein